MTDGFANAKLSVMDVEAVKSGVMTVGDAARRLGVTPRRVQQLASSGELVVVARGVLASSSVDALLARRRGSGRAWSEETAWGAVSLLSGRAAVWMGGSQRSRLSKKLKTMTVEEFVDRSRHFSQPKSYLVHDGVIARLRAETIAVVTDSRDFGLADTSDVDALVSPVQLESLVSRYGLSVGVPGNATLRVTCHPLDSVGELGCASTVVGALSLATSLSSRERHAGMDHLASKLEAFRDE